MNTGISEEEREAIRTQLNDLEQETLKEKNANPEKLGAKLEWLKEHSVEIAAVVVPVVTSVIKMACGVPP